MSAILGEKIKINASGRTDAMVNAKGQTFSFQSSSPLLKDEERFLYAINHVLPNDILIISAKAVSSSFHARYSALKKTYSYSFHLGQKQPFLAFEIAMLGNLKFDYILYKKAMNLFLGTHDFRSFTPKATDAKQFERTIYEISFSEKENGTYVTYITGDGFMTYQVRTMVGAAIKVALGKMSIDELGKRLIGERRKILTYKAPAEGLCLEKVYYK